MYILLLCLIIIIIIGSLFPELWIKHDVSGLSSVTGLCCFSLKPALSRIIYITECKGHDIMTVWAQERNPYIIQMYPKYV